MTNAQAALLAVVNLVTCAVSGAVVLQMAWKDWWNPLLVIGAACAVVSSVFLWFLERKMEDEAPERGKIAWAGNILFLVGAALGVVVAYVNGAFGGA